MSVEHVKAKTADILNSLPEHDLPAQKRTILKTIVVDFLNLLNRKSYRHSIVFLCRTTYIFYPLVILNSNLYLSEKIFLILTREKVQQHQWLTQSHTAVMKESKGFKYGDKTRFERKVFVP